MIDLQALVTAQESDELAALQAQLAAKDALIAAKNVELAKLNTAIDHGGINFNYDWVTTPATTLDLTGYVETFRDDFNVDSIMDVNGSPAGGKWYSPARTDDIGYASLQRSQVTVANGLCRIRIEQTTPPSASLPWGKWKTGHIQTLDRQGHGFAQPIVRGHPVYFEARMKFPEQLTPYGYQPNTGLPRNPQTAADSHGARGSWPSFWGLSANEMPLYYDTNHLIEFDWTEDYGGDINLHSTAHLKPRRIPIPRDPPNRQTNSETTPKNYTQWDGNFHDHGALYDDDFVTIYFDGKATTRYEMNKFMQIPMYLNITHALFAEAGQGPWPCKDPMDLFIEHVRVLAKP